MTAESQGTRGRIAQGKQKTDARGSREILCQMTKEAKELNLNMDKHNGWGDVTKVKNEKTGRSQEK